MLKIHLRKDVEPGSLRSYIVGFFACVVLTVAAYLVIDKNLLSGNFALAAILIFGVLQVFVQLVCFLHLGEEAKPRVNLLVFLFMVLVVVIVVVGSLWIMSELDYRVMEMGSKK